MAVSITSFGESNGQEVKLYSLVNSSGAMVTVSSFGADVKDIIVPDKDGIMVDVNLGFDNLEGYENDPYSFGAIVGRVANRTAGGRFTLNGVDYQLEKNQAGVNNLHSGPNTYNKRVWDSKVDGERVIFSLNSPDGDQGFPGEFNVSVSYEFTDEGVLRITYEGKSDADTVVNMTNHSYFNLNGEGEGDIMDHIIKINADYITETDPDSIPTGNLIDVTGTPFDFRQPKAISQDADEDHLMLKYGNGYDHNFAINGSGMREFAVVTGEKSGITMTVRSDLPGMQFYAGNHVGGKGNNIGKSGHEYGVHSGFALETQYFPNAINVPSFKSPILKAGESYKTVTEYIFS